MTARKILSLNMLLARLTEHRRRLDRIVFANGCFDLFHAGHLATLETARSLGDVLVVAVNSDDSVRRLKGPGRPIVPDRERACILAGLECVSYVTVFEDDTPERLIAASRPDVLVKSRKEASRVVGRELVESYGGRVVLTRVVPGLSTSIRLAEIADKDGYERRGEEAIVRSMGVVPSWSSDWETMGTRREGISESRLRGKLHPSGGTLPQAGCHSSSPPLPPCYHRF